MKFPKSMKFDYASGEGSEGYDEWQDVEIYFKSEIDLLREELRKLCQDEIESWKDTWPGSDSFSRNIKRGRVEFARKVLEMLE